MPKFPSSAISEMWKHPKEKNLNAINLIFNSEGDGLPVNIQVGTSCGIYALHAATNVLGRRIAPPARKQDADKDWRRKWEAKGSNPADRPRSIRSEAINGPDRLGQIGEINGADDLHKLAARMGIATEILTFGDVGQLWEHVVRSVDLGHAIVFPYTAANGLGEVARARGPDDFTHWGLLCGYSETRTPSFFIFMTTYGGYHMDHVTHLFESNRAIQDWSAQKWIKITLWTKESPNDWKRWKSEWIPDHNKKQILLDMAETAKKANLGFAFGTKDKPLYTLVEPPGGPPLSPRSRIPDSLPDDQINKSVEFTDMPYKANMIGKCVVVT